jgi:hypothetical protein
VADPEYEAAVARAAADPDVLGAILVGSRAIGPPFLRDGSDWDLRLVVTDASGEATLERLGTPHGSRVEVALLRLASFEGMTQPDSSRAWDRPSYVHTVLELDKLDGRIASILAAVARRAPEEAHRVAADAFDDYVNAYYRSLKNAAIGLGAEAHLDAIESIGPLLTTLFAIRGRVRPFNRHLGWELEHEALGDGWLAADQLLPRLRSVAASGDMTIQTGLFRDVEALARAQGLGAAVDSWEPDVPWLRSGRQ